MDPCRCGRQLGKAFTACRLKIFNNQPSRILPLTTNTAHQLPALSIITRAIYRRCSTLTLTHTTVSALSYRAFTPRPPTAAYIFSGQSLPPTATTMKVFSSTSHFDYDWEHVSTANWQKYSPWNEKSTHVIAVDTLSRHIDASTGIVRQTQ